MLRRIIDEKLIRASAVIGFWPANRSGADDIKLQDPNDPQQTLATLHHLRQQQEKASGKPNYSLADFVTPEDSGVADYVGVFVITACIGAEELAKEYKAKNDDYNSIMVKALADRLAEAFAEHMHAQVRKEFWAYAPEEALTNDELIRERYQGVRPAPGYPACPDHTEKDNLFRILNATEATGVTLT